jgi:hypothetical protein
MKTVNENLIGKKVFGNWGIAGGFNYGLISEILTEYNEIIVKWDESEDGLTESYYELKDIIIINEHTDIDKARVYIDVEGIHLSK